MMTDYFDLSGGVMTSYKSGRKVLDTSGALIHALPAAYDYDDTVTLTFPDFSSKGWLYNWRWHSAATGGTNSAAQNVGDSFVKIPKQKSTGSTILAAVPSGCNRVLLKVRINRTTAPSHTWLGSTIGVLPKQNVWIPFGGGSVLVEQKLGMCRAFSLIISSGNLVLYWEQSVSEPPYWAPNATGVSLGANSLYYGATGPSGGNGDGGEWCCDNASGPSGMPAYNIDHQGSSPIVIMGGGVDQSCRRTTASGFAGPGAASVTDPTNYRSVYSLDIKAKFARAA